VIKGTENGADDGFRDEENYKGDGKRALILRSIGRIGRVGDAKH